MPCNPSIGGTAKGHLVREIDALGGEMGRAADKNTLQSRMLNRGKGPAVHSLRAQIDRREYSAYMKHTLELQKGLHLRQGEIVDLWQEGGIWHAVTKLKAEYTAKAVVIASGTFLKGRIYVGDVNYDGGPDGTFAATELSAALLKLNIPLRRFKTGTPARVLKSSLNLDELEVQPGDDEITPFSYSTPEGEVKNKVVCHISYTNDKTRDVILKNLDRSPLYSGLIHGVGPRYCPSIEDKIVRFPDKKRHQLFIEPCGENTEEMYLQGMSSSLPEEVQVAFYKTIKGLENVQIMRTAYAIEYDCVDPTAAQGLVAGINAARKVQGREPMILDRSTSYIGTLIDDLVIKGCSDPYRMMTSRSEYRLILRQDNADERLMKYGRENGLVDDVKWNEYLERIAEKAAEIERLENTFLPPSDELNALLESRGTAPVTTGTRLADLIRRPQLDYACLAQFDKGRPSLPAAVTEKVEVEIKYSGYIKRQLSQIEEMKRLEVKRLGTDFDYDSVYGLRLEAVEKLKKIKPLNIGQASRISGVSPADISVLLIHLEKNKNK